MRLRAIVEEAGMRYLGARRYRRKVPGSPANQDWIELRARCPCGRAKTIHLRRESVAQLREGLRDHLQRDGVVV